MARQREQIALQELLRPRLRRFRQRFRELTGHGRHALGLGPQASQTARPPRIHEGMGQRGDFRRAIATLACSGSMSRRSVGEPEEDESSEQRSCNELHQ